MQGDGLEQELVRAVGDLALLGTRAEFVRFGAESPQDQFRAWAQDQVVHGLRILRERPRSGCRGRVHRG